MDEKIIWSIVFVLLVVVLCLAKPNAGRIFLGFFYLAMAIGVNAVNAFTDPLSTVQMGGASLLKIYRTLFTEVISKAPALFIFAITVFQIAMGLRILNKNQRVKIGLIGTTIFLILIAPFGIIQLPWLGIAAVQLYLTGKNFDKSFWEMVKPLLTKGKINKP